MKMIIKVVLPQRVKQDIAERILHFKMFKTALREDNTKVLDEYIEMLVKRTALALAMCSDIYKLATIEDINPAELWMCLREQQESFMDMIQIPGRR